MPQYVGFLVRFPNWDRNPAWEITIAPPPKVGWNFHPPIIAILCNVT